MNKFKAIELWIGIIILISNIGIGIITDFEVRCLCDSKGDDKCYTEIFEGLSNPKNDSPSHFTFDLKSKSSETEYISSHHDNTPNPSEVISFNNQSIAYSSKINSNKKSTIRD